MPAAGYEELTCCEPVVAGREHSFKNGFGGDNHLTADMQFGY